MILTLSNYSRVNLLSKDEIYRLQSLIRLSDAQVNDVNYGDLTI